MTPLIGATIGGRYRVRREIGRGAMGTVYVAEHVELGQEVAVKVLDSVQRHPSLQKRFFREARTAGSLDHPNLVRVFDLGTIEDEHGSIAYCVMELLKGRDMQRVMEERGVLPPAQVAGWMTGVGSAMDLIHAHGILHRDIKPENLFVAQTDAGQEAVRILDFGVAGFMAGQHKGGQRITQQGMLLGTPEYMPPEAATGGDTDHRADVYALGVVVFEALTGHLPFTSDSPLKLLTAKVESPAPALSEFGEFPRTLEMVVARVLDRDPRRRYPTGGAFTRDLAAACRGEPLSPRTIRDHATPIENSGAIVAERPSMRWRVIGKNRVIRKILVIDDDPGIRTLARVSLARVGEWEVIEAIDGMEGIALANEHKPDVVLLDVMMVGMDGRATLAQLDEEGFTAHTPVILLTVGGSQMREIVRGSPTIAGVIRKPFDPILLPNRIREIVHGGL